jgi:hypothetical protein
MSDFRDFLDACIGPTTGVLHVAVGYDMQLVNGKHKHRRWIETQFDWPSEADRAEREILREATTSDVYVCPNLMVGDKRAQGGAAARLNIKADIDGDFDLDKVREIGGFAVASGSLGHAHVYVPLAESVPAYRYTALCRALGGYLGNADSKISDNDVLRPPGTYNHKPTVTGLAPASVRWLVRPTGVRVDLDTLALALGITLSDRAASSVRTNGHQCEKFDLAEYPLVQTAIEKNSGDRSADTMRVVGACFVAGLKLEHARFAVAVRTDLSGRLAERNDDDVLNCWLKAVDSRQNADQISEAAAAAAPHDAVPPIPIEQAHKVFQRWLGDDYDTDALDAMLAVAAVEKFNDLSDLVWLLLVSGPGNAKTETVQSLDGIGAIVTSAISSEAALLSATPKRERVKGATGGLLRKIGDRGVLVIKDATSILSMNRDLRARVLAALREIYDGRWYREVGTDGGLTIPWEGRIAVIGAVTTAWDAAHAVISTMGDRFVLVRLDSTTKRQAAGRKAIGNTGEEQVMRAELAAAVAGVLAGMATEPTKIAAEETDVLLRAADLVTLARTGVEYDYRGDVIDAHAPEMPTRFAKQLAQILRGAVAIGMDRSDALRLAIRCARDSMPPLRLAIIEDLAEHPDSTTGDVRKRIDKPRATVDRQLQALHMLGVVAVDEEEYTADGKTKWFYTLANHIEPDVLKRQRVPDLSVHTPIPSEDSPEEPALVPDKSGTPRRPGCDCAHQPQPCYWCQLKVEKAVS